MQEIFSIKRFGLYALRMWSLYAKKYLIAAGAVLAAMLISLFLVRFVDEDSASFALNDIRDLSHLWFRIFFIVFLLGFVGITMGPLKSRHTMIMENSVPASGTERWLFVLVNTTVVVAALFLSAVFVTALVGRLVSDVGTVGDYFYPADGEWRSNGWSILLVLQAMAMYAGTMERRSHVASFMTVVLAVGGILFITEGFPAWLSERLDGPMRWGSWFTFGRGTAASEFSRVDYIGGLASRPGLGVCIVNLKSICVVSVLWVASWFNFRERSIK